MDIVQFQRALEDVLAAAKENGNRISAEELGNAFAGMDLDREKMLRVLGYLQGKGITVADEENAGRSFCTDGEIVFPGTRKELSQEEQEYLKGLFSGFSEERAKDGKEKLRNRYMRRAAELAAKWHCEELLLADLIQEAQMALLIAMQEDVPEGEQTGEWYEQKILEGIRSAIQNQLDQKYHDDVLVEKVTNLEKAIRELTDEEDGEVHFTAAELAVILDMKEEELQDILRLTGDDTENDQGR